MPVKIASAVDSLGMPNYSILKAAGVTAAGRYGRVLVQNPAEIGVAHSQDRGLWFIHEYEPNDPLRGSAWGDQDAHISVSQMLQLGFPRGCTDFLTLDAPQHPSDWGIIEAYWRAAGPIIQAAGYLRGFYAGEDIIDHLLLLGLIDVGWGVGALSWSNGHRSEMISLRQLADQRSYGVTCDLDDVFKDFGAWYPDGPHPSPNPSPNPAPPAPTPGDDTMVWSLMQEASPDNPNLPGPGQVFVVMGLSKLPVRDPESFKAESYIQLVQGNVNYPGPAANPPVLLDGFNVWLCAPDVLPSLHTLPLDA